MSFLDRIRECNGADLLRFRRFAVAKTNLGWVRDDVVRALLEFPEVFRVNSKTVRLAPHLTTAEARTAAVDDVLRALAARGLVKGWRDELYPVTADFGALPFFLMERAAVPLFGLRAFGVHVNGHVRGSDGPHLWVAHRARGKASYPGQLDNVVAGGQPAGLSLLDNVTKECAEEAGIPATLARRAVPVGVVTYKAGLPEGYRPDVLFCFDLELPADFVPRAADGEVERFELLPVGEVAAIVRDTRRFKFNCNLVIIDFLVRHGLIPPHHPDYVAIVQGLRQ